MSPTLVLVTSAWLAVADTKPETKPAPAPAPAPVHATAQPCNKCAPTCCEETKPTLWQRLRDRFRKDDCCDPCPCPCPPPKVVHCAPAASCCEPCCDRPSLLDRLRAWFRRDKDCCDPCATPCCGSAPAAQPPAQMPKAGESLPKPEPKKMPTGGSTQALPQLVPTSQSPY